MTKHYFCTICVLLHKPMEIPNGAVMETVVGYYRNFGLGALSESAARYLVSQSVVDGKIDWNDSSCKEINLRTFDKEISAHCKDPNQEGIWYRSGQALFPREKQGDVA